MLRRQEVMDKETKVENGGGVLDKIKQMVDVSTVVGDPIPCPAAPP